MTEDTHTYHGLKFVCTCLWAPEQYDVFQDTKMVGYVRLRHGVLSANLINPDGSIGVSVYSFYFPDMCLGSFSTQADRAFYLKKIAEVLNLALT